jgi:hypothetical protein
LVSAAGRGEGDGPGRQHECAGGEALEGLELAIDGEGDGMDDAVVLVEIDEVEGGQRLGDGYGLEALQPDAGAGLGVRAFDENLENLEGFESGVENADIEAEKDAPALVECAVSRRFHRPSSG